ncbi:STAS domain-containing protein [Actinoplanes sp. NPDC051851]|uniref:STAS domain-containing protein n=1 Tax=Actinoplanes sp. NPDC051851 TaxID=3154753 RepID=UPI0034434BC0
MSGAAGGDRVGPIAAITAGTGALVIRLAGELDGATTPVLHDRLRAVITTGHSHEIMVDLTDVDFCDAATVRLFVVLATEAADQGHSLRLWKARPHIVWLFRQLGAEFLFTDG